jgi:transcriptional regulator with XRE-family HTH domain
MPAKESLGQRLQRLRLAAGLTQEQLAEAAGVPVWSLRNWEHDHRLPGLVPVYKLAKVLGITMEELAVCAVDQTGLVRRKRPG